MEHFTEGEVRQSDKTGQDMDDPENIRGFSIIKILRHGPHPF